MYAHTKMYTTTARTPHSRFQHCFTKKECIYGWSIYKQSAHVKIVWAIHQKVKYLWQTKASVCNLKKTLNYGACCKMTKSILPNVFWFEVVKSGFSFKINLCSHQGIKQNIFLFFISLFDIPTQWTCAIPRPFTEVSSCSSFPPHTFNHICIQSK